MRRPIIIGNWKMHKNIKETQDFIHEVEKQISKIDNIDVGIAVSAPLLETAVKTSNKLIISAQNCYSQNSGAFTGEVSPELLQSLKVTAVVLGHSERKTIFHETETMINEKVITALANNLQVILCCGETETEYSNNQTETIVREQLKINLMNVPETALANIVIAYEPIWAIGTGKTPTAEEAQKVCYFIRTTITNLYSEAASNKIRIQYGGSVNPNNINDFLQQNDIDGALVGGASLNVDSFLNLLLAKG